MLEEGGLTEVMGTKADIVNQQLKIGKENPKQLKKQTSCILVRYAKNLNTKNMVKEQEKYCKNKMVKTINVKIKGTKITINETPEEMNISGNVEIEYKCGGCDKDNSDTIKIKDTFYEPLIVCKHCGKESKMGLTITSRIQETNDEKYLNLFTDLKAYLTNK